MKFGVREICDIVIKAASANQKLGTMTLAKYQPAIYIDSAKTSSIEGAATTVYAQGGKGNNRLVTWEGEKTLTFTFEDALLSEKSFSMLSGAGLIEKKSTEKYYVHTTADVEVPSTGQVTIPGIVDDKNLDKCPIYYAIKDVENDDLGEFKALTDEDVTPGVSDTTLSISAAAGKAIFVDYYKVQSGAGANYYGEMQIDAAHFAGTWYVEASTLFRRSDGKDVPVNITIPKAKIQSNFSFSMASTGDPSTFTFTMDAMPDYTIHNKNKKVLCAFQVIDPTDTTDNWESVFAAPQA